MPLPFSRDAFFNVFSQYHSSTWPATWIWYAAAVIAIGNFAASSSPRPRVLLLFCGSIWLWMGLVYHWWFFSAINNAANIFAIAFVIQAGLLIRSSLLTLSPIRSSPPRRSVNAVSFAMIMYALIVYPLIGYYSHHGYPRGPILGLPCPTTILTLALLLLLRSRYNISRWLFAIPIAWSAIGTVAAMQLEVTEDWMLGFSGAVALYLTAFTLPSNQLRK